MTVHLIKLCVGVSEVAELARWQRERVAAQKRKGIAKPVLRHLTRNTPKRAEEIIDGGSLYWVIKGIIRVRQRIVGIGPANFENGEPCCELRLGRQLVRVVPRPCRAFQGWRYLEPADAPDDLAKGDPLARIPPGMAEELRTLGLL
jgi:hypothetical protein